MYDHENNEDNLTVAWQKCLIAGGDLEKPEPQPRLVSEDEETLDEGILDRFKARVASASSNLSNKVGSGVTKMGQRLTGDKEGLKRTQEREIEQSLKNTPLAKVVNNYTKEGGKFEKQMNNLFGDIIRLTQDEEESRQLNQFFSQKGLKQKLLDALEGELNRQMTSFFAWKKEQDMKTPPPIFDQPDSDTPPPLPNQR